MPRFRIPVNIATTAVAIVVGATSATAATHLVLASDAHPAATSAEGPPAGTPGGTPGGGDHHGTTSTTVHPEHGTEPHPSTTVTTTPPPTAPGHHEPPPTYPTTSTTVHYEPGTTTSTTRPPERHEPPSTYPTTSTTAKPTTTTAPSTTVQTLTLACATGMPDGTPTASCTWSKSTAPGFHHYRLTREVVGTPRQEIFTTTDHDSTGYVDHGLQVGANYSYIIEAYDADGHLIAHSPPFHFTCCEGASPTT